MTDGERAQRAAAAESSVRRRHLRRPWWYPSAWLGVPSHPAHWKHRVFLEYHYWWQAHLLDCLIDAELRDPELARRRMIKRLPFAIRRRNGGRWLNAYFDDIAWLALAMGRSERLLGIDHGPARRLIAGTLHEAWSTDAGGIPWRRGDDFRNVPANGSMAIVMARVGRSSRAGETLDWIHGHLLDGQTGLILEGVRGGEVDPRIFTYNQGLVIGAELEMVLAGADPARLYRLVAAVRDHLTAADVLRGSGGGDGGLFAGITARYLAAVARQLPEIDSAAAETRRQARALVFASAEACWVNRADTPEGPVFSAHWDRPAPVPTADSRVGHGGIESECPERDLSVQLGAWMLLEAAAALERAG